MQPIKAFFCEETNMRRIYLRRYSMQENYPCREGRFHDHWVFIRDEPFEWRIWDDGGNTLPLVEIHDRSDPRWPAKCSKCEYAFDRNDAYQEFQDLLFRRVDTGELLPIRDMPPGALYFDEHGSYRKMGYFGPDGKTLVAKVPGGGEWCIDSRARNCTMPTDRKHRCWVRHGDPKTGDIHVDKNGLTCSAGGGSIKTHNWHGFLHNGYFHE